MLLAVPAAPAFAQGLALTLDDIEHPSFSAQRIALRLADLSGGSAELDIGRLALAGREFKHVRLRCGQLRVTRAMLDCRHGALEPARGAALPLEFTYRSAIRQLELSFKDAEFGGLAALLPEIAAYQPSGRFDARIQVDAEGMELTLQLHQLAFASADGKLAGEKIETSLAASAERNEAVWNWRADLTWPGGETGDSGEAYWAPLYRAGGAHLTAAGQLAPETLTVSEATLALDGIGSASGSLHWQRGSGKLLAATIYTGPLDLAAAVPQLVQPFLDLGAGPKLAVSGQGRVVAHWDAAGMSRLDLAFDDAALEAGTAFALHGITARIPWRREQATQAEFRAAGGRFGRLPLGAIDLPLSMQGLEFSLPYAEIALLDGKLLFEDFHAARVGGEWQWRLGGALHPLAMPLLTQALGLPHMAGLLSASIPKISYANATLALDGRLVISVFDGYLSASGLQVIEPFGRLPRLLADIEARHLDLGMLTETFSFGDISGYIDGDIQGLEMSGMRPLSFAARIRSSPGDYRKRISQRAVQNISSLGGAGAGAAIQRSFLRFFETFGYDKLGLSCRLLNDICEMGGIEAAPQGYVIVKGGGIPALSVIGYNRRVYWDELVSRLQAVIAGNGKIEIR